MTKASVYVDVNKIINCRGNNTFLIISRMTSVLHSIGGLLVSFSTSSSFVGKPLDRITHWNELPSSCLAISQYLLVDSKLSLDPYDPPSSDEPINPKYRRHNLGATK